MNLRRIVIGLHEDRRVILYPEGGLEIEERVPGIGWCIENNPDRADNPELLELVKQAADLCSHAACNLAPPSPKQHARKCACLDCAQAKVAVARAAAPLFGELVQDQPRLF